MPIFSMSDPFASLLLNGVKQVETRNSGVLAAAGSGPCLLQIGRKVWPGEDWMEELWQQKVPEKEWGRLTHPPPPFRRGCIAGVVELGETYAMTEEEMDSSEMRTKVVARKENMGKFATPVLSAQWLKRPMMCSGRPGVWKTWVWKDMLPPDVAARVPDFQEELWEPLEVEGRLPKLVVFDLDGCCWHPEMYQTTGGAPFRLVGSGGRHALNSAGEEVMLRRSAQGIWGDLWDAAGRWADAGTKVAVASSSYADKALPLLETFEVRPGVRMIDVVDNDLVEIYYRKVEGKKAHLTRIRDKSGVDFQDMLFFDDAKDNIDNVSSLGVVCQHTPDGLTAEVWREGLEKFALGQTRPSQAQRRINGSKSLQLAAAWLDRTRAHQTSEDPVTEALAKAARAARLAKSRPPVTPPAPVKPPLPTRQGIVNPTSKKNMPLIQERRRNAWGAKNRNKWK